MDELFKTGVVSALTEIPPQSLYAYTRHFGEFFSDKAKQHQRGRRWTEADVYVLLSIRALYHERLGQQGIKDKLSSGWRLESDPVPNPGTSEAISKLLQIANQLRSQALESQAQAQHWANKLSQYALCMEKDHDTLMNMQKVLLRHDQAITRLLTEKRSFLTFNR